MYFLRSVLRYAFLIFSSTTDGNFNKLQIVENKCLTTILGKKSYLRNEELYNEFQQKNLKIKLRNFLRINTD